MNLSKKNLQPPSIHFSTTTTTTTVAAAKSGMPLLKHELPWYFSYYKYKLKVFLRSRYTLLLKIMTYLILAYLAYKIEFLIIFCIISTIVFIWWFGLDYSSHNSKKDGIHSAYSVFNKNQARIPGTFTAEDIDRTIRRGGGII
jgi:hypothetical protein